MKKSILIISVITFTLYSCSNTNEKLISKQSIESDYNSLKENNQLSGRQDSVLTSLVSLAKGREEYIKQNNLDENTSKLLVSEDEFKKVTDELFQKFTSSETKYGDLLNEVNDYEKDQRLGSKMLDSLYTLVDQRCSEIQSEIDSTNIVLNKLIEFKLQTIKSGTYNYRDYVGVSILATNKSGKTVEAVSFNVTIYDKLDEAITTLRCTSSKRFNNSSNLYYEYEEYDYDRRDIYKALEQTTMRRVGRIEQQIRRINLNGEILGKDRANIKYSSPNTLDGTCLYLDLEGDNKLSKAIEQQKEKNQQLISSYKTLNSITSISTSLISLENFQKSLRDALKGI